MTPAAPASSTGAKKKPTALASGVRVETVPSWGAKAAQTTAANMQV